SDRQEPGTGDEIALVPTRKKDADRESREVLAGQESFARQITVRVKIRLVRFRVTAQQQIQLSFRLSLHCVGSASRFSILRPYRQECLLLKLLCPGELVPGSAEQLTPTVKGPIKPVGRAGQNFIEPSIGEPFCTGRFSPTGREHSLARLQTFTEGCSRKDN